MAYELQDFQKEVVEASESIPVVLDFWAEWCGPCRQLGPVIEKLAKEAEGRWKLVKIDTEQHRELAGHFNIRGIPAVKMVYQGELIAEFSGAQPEHVIRQWLEENLPSNGKSDSEQLANEVKSLLGKGKREEAREKLQSHIHDIQNAKLSVLYAMLLLPDDISQSTQILESVEKENRFEIEFETIGTIQHLKSIQEGSTKPETDNEKSLDLYLKGIDHLFRKEFEPSFQHFLQCLQIDRSLDDDGARKACIALFTLLTEHHPLAAQYRRRFSMSLY